MAFHVCLLLKVLLVLGVAATEVASQGTRKFTIANNCKETVWPGLTNSESFNISGFALKPGQSAVYTASATWSGRIWGRTGCDFDKNGNGKCQTGGCGTSLNCTGPGTPPVSIAEFTLGEPDYYDVSLVDGFNLPIVIKALNAKENCSNAGCDGDLRSNCPSDLTVKSDGKVIACNSACDMFNTDELCCRGAFATAQTCQPSNYSKAFKSFCPDAYSYAKDDPTSLKTCTSPEYALSFCSSRNATVCSFHDGSSKCNGSTDLRASFYGWWFLVIVLPMIVGTHQFLGFIM
ncbi:pathogenesis-related thaumatin-like protein 3.5 isoform X2 [Syzygium oleosum]|uniref:pathogenesis-related thaumatin-like protein 3.5 isoform X2 n=1 Tax=Syzygium oleosum TaxID=219896 RepID=UPI0011D18BB2|nr:pathogenesis-related thaumatin-like protein 3.5 isoform X2 [Syzygium oleosum]